MFLTEGLIYEGWGDGGMGGWVGGGMGGLQKLITVLGMRNGYKGGRRVMSSCGE
jgi:hypothetical protein